LPSRWRPVERVQDRRVAYHAPCLFEQVALEIVAIESEQTRFIVVSERFAETIRSSAGGSVGSRLVGAAAVAVLQPLTQAEFLAFAITCPESHCAVEIIVAMEHQRAFTVALLDNTSQGVQHGLSQPSIDALQT